MLVTKGYKYTFKIGLGEEKRVYGVLVGEQEGQKPLGRPRRRWVDIRMDL
jgi:hypothetical protein